MRFSYFNDYNEIFSVLYYISVYLIFVNKSQSNSPNTINIGFLWTYFENFSAVIEKSQYYLSDGQFTRPRSPTDCL
jgi:hypothetical protein